MKTLITGATGFVGSAVTRKLLEQGGTIRALCRARSNTRNLSGLPVEIMTGDLTDTASLQRAVAGCEALFHVAADYRLWVPRPEVLYRSNVRGTRDLMRAALEAGLRRIVYTSSVATLGLNSDGTPADERTPVTIEHMIGHYKRSKYLAEQEVSRLVAENGLPAVIVNPSTPVGPRDIRPTPTGRMVLDAAAGRMPAFVDTGLNVAHVDDVAEGHLLAFERGETGERYILGGENLSLRDILGHVAEITGGKPPRIRLPHNLVLPFGYVTETWARLFRTGEPRLTVDGVRMAKKWMYFSSHKARVELGYQPRPAREALADAVTWFRDNGYL
ncbi:MAG: NAD-dependent epimerase/dehydratase family protein [Gammaproteobacteria bacterium]|jgi:dihydroflavonol-4-reductase|nr:NAD-dependent epimerase/dehydratase family protein [Gammaproteobacteria bacterium]